MLYVQVSVSAAVVLSESRGFTSHQDQGLPATTRIHRRMTVEGAVSGQRALMRQARARFMCMAAAHAHGFVGRWRAEEEPTCQFQTIRHQRNQ